MTVMDQTRFSRPAAMAAALQGDHQFSDKSVLLCGEPAILLTPNGHETFRAAFLMLIRVCKNVSVQLPSTFESLRKDVEELGRRFIPKRELRFLTDEADLKTFTAILSVGVAGHKDLPWTVVSSNGWVAYVSSRGKSLPGVEQRQNAIAAIGAACLGVAEVFKRLIVLRDTAGELVDVASFSFWNYASPGAPGDGVDLRNLKIDVLLAGCGAIGSAVAYVLSRLPVSGRVLTLDRQQYRPENFGTSLIVGEQDKTAPKADSAAQFLSAKLDTTPFVMDIETFSRMQGIRLPDVILSGLDEVKPRHQVQQLWPDLIIDGATGADLSCQVSAHLFEANSACLLCLFKDTPPAAVLSELNARATGLPHEIANNPDAIVTEEMIAAAKPERRPWLRERLGRQVCSITSEAILKFLSAETHKEGFAPAAPFLAAFSACMMVTELARYVLTGETVPAPRFQTNFRWGPHRGLHYEEHRHPDCCCVQRAANIRTIRQRGRPAEPHSRI